MSKFTMTFVFSLGLLTFGSSCPQAQEAEAIQSKLKVDSIEWQTTEWGEGVSGVRMRVTLPKEVGYGDSIPAIVEIEIDQGELPGRRRSALTMSPKSELQLVLTNMQTREKHGSNIRNLSKQIGKTTAFTNFDIIFSIGGIKCFSIDPYPGYPFAKSSPDPVCVYRGLDGNMYEGYVELKIPKTRMQHWFGTLRTGGFVLKITPEQFETEMVEVRYPAKIFLRNVQDTTFTRIVMGRNNWDSTLIPSEYKSFYVEKRAGFAVFSDVRGGGHFFLKNSILDFQTDRNTMRHLYRKFGLDTLTLHAKIMESSHGEGHMGVVLGWGYRVLWEGDIKIAIEASSSEE